MLPSHSVPPDSSWFTRQIDGLREALREGLASVAKSIAPQIEFLLNQTTLGECSTYWESVNQGSSESQLAPFDGSIDAAVTVTTSSTGQISVQAGADLAARVLDGGAARIGIGIEVLQGATIVRNPVDGEGGKLSAATLRVNEFTNISINASSSRRTISLTPNATYTVRCRRFYMTNGGHSMGGGIYSWARTGVAFTSISVTKLGM